MELNVWHLGWQIATHEQASLYTATAFDTTAITIMNTARYLSPFFAML